MGAGPFTRGRIVAVALGLVAVLLAFLIAHDVLFPAAPAPAAARTATVTMGSVRSAVSGTGTVVPAQQQNVTFGQAGTLADVDVKVGDAVKKGQVLARLDTTALQQALDQASNGLVQAQATLGNTLNGNAVAQAQHGLANAQQSLSDIQAQVNLTNQQDAGNVANDQNQLSADQAALGAAQARRDQAQAAVDADRAALAQAQSSYDAHQCGTPSAQPDCPSLTASLQSAQAVLNTDTQALGSAQSAFSQAQSAVNADQAKLTQDQTKQAADLLSGQRSVNSAQAQVTTAQDALNSQTIQRPNTITSQQASVANAQLQVQAAQRNLAAATLTAPFDATVLSITGQVGEAVSAGAGATAQSPGSTAPQPASSSTTAASGGTGGGSPFMVLGNVSGLEVIAPFAEADAARLAADQQATITFDAVAGLTAPAHVLAVAASATVISNVTNYYATLVVDRVDQRLKPGMTANASVIVQQAQNVLTLPNSAITRIGGSAFVTLLGRDGRSQSRQTIETGAVGDSSTEIVSGLNLGDKVVLPQLRTGAGTQGGAVRGGGLGGGGGVRLG